MQSKEVVIIGAGVSGLVAAIELERKGFLPTIIDKNNFIGGRLATEIEDGIPFDAGFQVLLTEYPLAKEYLNYDGLDLLEFSPGALVHHDGVTTKFGDPLRKPAFLVGTAFSKIGSFNDKLLMFKLQTQLKGKEIKEIFEEPELTTHSYLKNYGFSDNVIKRFFQPFFAGIFLEEKLETSSRMFEFIFKMFSEGKAAVPRLGINRIAQNLQDRLKKTQFILGKRVEDIGQNELSLSDGSKFSFDKCIMTGYNGKSKVEWKSCENLYFETTSKIPKERILGLLTHNKKYVNNYHYLSNLLDPTIKTKNIISVTVVRQHDLSVQGLINAVQMELRTFLKLEGLALIKYFKISRALPVINNVKYTSPTPGIDGNIIYAGDYTLQGSLNGAMMTGREAGRYVAQTLSKIKT